MYIYKAAVVGAGAMGAEIAQTISFSGLPVVIKDLNQELVDKGIARARAIYQGRVDRGKMSAADVEPKMALISGATTYDGFEDVDIVIEAVNEKMDLKKQVFKELEQATPETCILASNTSALSISEIASATTRAAKVVGMHFFYPAHVMKLVEVIPGLETSDETVDDTAAFSESLRKIPVRVQECAGFLVNRLLLPYLNEAVMALQEGAASAPEIDAAMREWGFPMGPFTLCDVLGLDVCAAVGRTLYDSYGPRMAPARLWEKIVERQRYGVKSKAGFYSYAEEGGGGVDEAMQKMIGEVQKETGISGTEFSVERLIYPMINEAVICLQEHVSSASDMDIAMLAGIGFPQDKGGVLKYADTIGLDLVLASLERYTKELGPRFWPAPMLKRMVAAGHLGRKAGRGFFTY
jgi:3-hydroxyacyl-CoA dehydrogenase